MELFDIAFIGMVAAAFLIGIGLGWWFRAQSHQAEMDRLIEAYKRDVLRNMGEKK